MEGNGECMEGREQRRRRGEVGREEGEEVMRGRKVGWGKCCFMLSGGQMWSMLSILHDEYSDLYFSFTDIQLQIISLIGCSGGDIPYNT
jgi:hypothetical protein